MKSLIVFQLMISFCAAQSGRPPEVRGDGWRALLDGHDTAGWHSRDGKPDTWYTAAEVHLEQSGTHTLLKGTGGPGPVMINGPDGRTTDFITNEKLGDMELYLEFMIPAKSNSGVYVEALYEVQILDSFGVKQPGVHDCGAIYERWINGKGVGGSPPLVNVSRAPAACFEQVMTPFGFFSSLRSLRLCGEYSGLTEALICNRSFAGARDDREARSRS